MITGARRIELEDTLSELPQFKDLKEVELLIKDIEIQELSYEFPEDQAPIKINGINSIKGYNVNWSGARKAQFVLRENKKGMTTKEIVDYILTIEPNCDKKALTSNLSSVLGTKSRNLNIFYRSQNDLGEFVYFLMEWDQHQTDEIISMLEMDETTPVRIQ